MKSIYEYSDPNLFFKDKWIDLKRKRPELSVRSLANFLHLKSHGPLHQMILGKRKIGQSYVPMIAQYLQLTERESLYFDILVKFSRAQSIIETNFYLETLKELKPKNIPTMELVNNYEVQREPLCFIIMELTEMEDLPNDHLILKKKLTVNYTSFEIKGALSLLLETGYLKLNEKGFLKKTYKHLYSEQDKKNLALVQYHQKLSTLAHAAVGGQDLSEREFNGTSFNISKERLPQIKEELRDFLIQMISKYESAPNEGDATYQFNLQFFKVAEK